MTSKYLQFRLDFVYTLEYIIMNSDHKIDWHIVNALFEPHSLIEPHPYVLESTRKWEIIEPPFGRGLKNRATCGSKRAFTVIN